MVYFIIIILTELLQPDDWLISQCFELESNKTYTLGFKYRVVICNYPERMNVCIGTSQQSSSLTTVLLQMNTLLIFLTILHLLVLVFLK